MPSFTETIKVNGQDMEIYSAIPEGSGPFPAVVVAHHGSGADKFSKTMADRLAGGWIRGRLPQPVSQDYSRDARRRLPAYQPHERP